MEFYGYSSKKNLLLFNSLGLEGFKFFIVDNDENIIDELLYNFKKWKITNQKITLCTMKFSTNNWEKLVHTKKKTVNRYSSKRFSFIK